MFYSDGTKNPGVDPNTGLPTAPNPAGFNTLTSIDIIGHEMTHGVTANSDALDYDGESGGLNEATSDIMGSMVEAWATRQPGADWIIPDTGTDWLMGAQISDSPLRSMIHPSTDGVSADHWYAGIQYLDVHFSSGPLNRFFYFLSQGASSDPASDAYSPYLPEGMKGIGNDRAARRYRLEFPPQRHDRRVAAHDTPGAIRAFHRRLQHKATVQIAGRHHSASTRYGAISAATVCGSTAIS
jgi:hypothetical protein